MKFRWLTAAALSLSVVAAPAFAHDELVDQSPQSNEIVAAGIVEIKLTFSDDLIALGDGSGSEIVILDAAGQPVNNGCAVVEGNIAIAKADIDQAGTYQVGWRAVSSDGHPISDSFRFEVENNTGYVADPTYEFTTCANPYNPQALAESAESPEFFYWILFGSLGLAALALLLLLRPKKPLEGS
ncbi:MAG: copper resistance protein CopC [Aquiluna sp.]|nr:copper resistance protein CopC [Aquiluna sp.]